MILNQHKSDAQFQIRAYDPGRITVNGTVYQHSLIITSDKLITDWRPQNLAEITLEDWEPILALAPEIILLGTGTRFQMPKTQLLVPLYAKRMGIESMDTGAACRTYTALVSEGRRVLAALLIN